MIHITSVTLRNFLSVGQKTQIVNLAAPGLTLVLGKNVDIGSANSRNGCGKSTLAQAISFGLYGEPLTSIRLDNLVNNINGKSMHVSIDFTSEGKSYRIERGRKPNVLRLLTNGQEDTETDQAQGENKHTQAEIERILGMSHTLFSHLVILNTSTLPFLRCKPAEQREVIEELLAISALSKRDEALMKLIVVTKGQVRDEETTIKATIDANARIQQAIERAGAERDRWSAAQETKIATMREQLADLSGVDFDKEASSFDLIDRWVATDRELRQDRAGQAGEITTLERSCKALTAQMDRTASEPSNTLETSVGRLKLEIRRCDAEAKKGPDDAVARLRSDAARRETDAAKREAVATAKGQELEGILAEMEQDGHSCTTCGQELSGTDHYAQMVAKLSTKAEQLSGEVDQCLADAKALRADAATILGEIDDVVAKHTVTQAGWVRRADEISIEIIELEARHEQQAADTAAKIVLLQGEHGAAQAGIAELRKAIECVNQSILALGDKPHSDYASRQEVWEMREAVTRLSGDVEREVLRDNPHVNNIASLEATVLEIDYTSLHDTQSLLKHQDFLHKLLSSKDSFVRKKIIDQNLINLNGRMNKYLDELGLPHEARFMPDLSVEISLLGRELDFAQLSRGEMNRVNLAISFSFRDAWESLNSGLSLVVVDEMMDNGMDEAGAEAALAVLNGMARRGKNVFLISHKETLMGRVNRILMVHKEAQFTRFEEDAELG